MNLHKVLLTSLMFACINGGSAVKAEDNILEEASAVLKESYTEAKNKLDELNGYAASTLKRLSPEVMPEITFGANGGEHTGKSVTYLSGAPNYLSHLSALSKLDARIKHVVNKKNLPLGLYLNCGLVNGSWSEYVKAGAPELNRVEGGFGFDLSLSPIKNVTLVSGILINTEVKGKEPGGLFSEKYNLLVDALWYLSLNKENTSVLFTTDVSTQVANMSAQITNLRSNLRGEQDRYLGFAGDALMKVRADHSFQYRTLSLALSLGAEWIIAHETLVLAKNLEDFKAGNSTIKEFVKSLKLNISNKHEKRLGCIIDLTGRIEREFDTSLLDVRLYSAISGFFVTDKKLREINETIPYGMLRAGIELGFLEALSLYCDVDAYKVSYGSGFEVAGRAGIKIDI